MANPLRSLLRRAPVRDYRLPPDAMPVDHAPVSEFEERPVNPLDNLGEPPPMTRRNPLRAAMSEGGDETASVNIGPMTGVELTRAGGRPVRSNINDPADREYDYQQQLSEYTPRNEGLGKTALRSAMGLIAGPAHAISPWLHRDASDEQWRNRELARSGNMSDQLGVRALRKSQITENEAQTARANRDDTRPTYDWFPRDTDGDGIPDTETYQPIKSGSTKQLFRKALQEDNPLIVEVKNADGSTSRKVSRDKGRTWTTAEGLGDAVPPVKPDKDSPKRGAMIRQSQTLYKKADNLDGQAAALDEHIKKLEAGRTTIPEYIDLGTVDKPKPSKNPALASFDSQLRELRDKQESLRKEARGLRVDGDKARSEGESIAETSAPASQGAPGPTISKANLARYARDHNMTIEQAKASPDLQGVIIR